MKNNKVYENTKENVCTCCGSVQVRDAVAVIQLLMWLEKAVPEGEETELTSATYVNTCRKWVHTMYEKWQEAFYLVVLTLLVQVQYTKNVPHMCFSRMWCLYHRERNITKPYKSKFVLIQLHSHHYYSKQKDSRGPSFETISASGPNAALAHYR